MFESEKKWRAELARALGMDEASLIPDERGALGLQVGEQCLVVIWALSEAELMISADVGELPKDLDWGSMFWLLRRNYHDSPNAPFSLGCGPNGILSLWGRVPALGASGQSLAGLIDAIATEVEFIAEEIRRAA